MKLNAKKLILSLSIPFCLRGSFAEGSPLFYGTKETKRSYLDAMQREIENALENGDFEDREVAAVEFIGPAPSIMNADKLGQLALFIRRKVPLTEGCPFSIRALPQTIGTPSLSAWGVGKFNQFELDVLSLQPSELETLKASHTVADVQNAILFFDRFRLNAVTGRLIYGIPGQTLLSWKKTLKSCVQLEPPHIKITPLLTDELAVVNISDDLVEFYGYAQEFLAERGYQRQTPNTFSLKETERTCDRLAYEDADILGIGSGAHSRMYGYRYKNTDDYEAYVSATDFTSIIEQVFEETESSRATTAIYNKLALGEKVKSIPEEFSAFVEESNGTYSLTSKGSIYWPYLQGTL